MLDSPLFLLGLLLVILAAISGIEIVKAFKYKKTRAVGIVLLLSVILLNWFGNPTRIFDASTDSNGFNGIMILNSLSFLILTVAGVLCVLGGV